MRCKKVVRSINMYVDNELPENEKSSVRTHISECSKCSQIFNELMKIKENMGKIPVYSPNPFLWTRIEAELRQNPYIPDFLNIPQLIRGWVLAASLLLVIFGAALYKLPRTEETSDTMSPSITNSIMEIPNTPENMEKITLNFLVYTNGYAWEAPYARF